MEYLRKFERMGLGDRLDLEDYIDRQSGEQVKTPSSPSPEWHRIESLHTILPGSTNWSGGMVTKLWMQVIIPNTNFAWASEAFFAKKDDFRQETDELYEQFPLEY